MNINNGLKGNTVYSIIKTVSGIIFPLITFPYISRVLGPDSLGKINFGNSIVSYISLIASLGITTYAIRECSKFRDNKESLSKIGSEIFSINCFTTILAYCALAGMLLLWSDLYPYRILIVIQSLSVFFTLVGAEWLNMAMEDFKYITIRTVVFQFIALGLMLVFVHRPEQYILYAITTVVSSSGANIVNAIHRKKYCRLRFTLQINWKERMPSILLLFAMILSQTLLANIDITMIGIIKDNTNVGLYSTAHRIYDIASRVISSIIWVVMPGLSNAFYNRDYETVNQSLKYTYNFSFVLGIPCAIGLFVLAPEIIMLLGGSEYLSATNCLRILAISLLFVILNIIYGNVILLSSFKEKVFMVACTIAAVINLITNYLLIPKYGIEAAAFTTMISQLVMYLISKNKIDKNININNKQLIQPIISSFPMVIICLTLKFLIGNMFVRLVLAISTSAVIYILILVVLKNDFVVSFINPLLNRLKKK